MTSELTPHRLDHSLSVERTAIDLARRHGLSVDLASEAGLLHDNAKDMPLAQLRDIAREAKLPLDEELFSSVALLHAPVGALRAERVYGVQEETVLEAIRWHTTGRADMRKLEMVIYLADLVEPEREPYPGWREIGLLARENLEEAMLLALSQSIAYIRQRKKHLHPDTKRAYLYFLEKNGGEQ